MRWELRQANIKVIKVVKMKQLKKTLKKLENARNKTVVPEVLANIENAIDMIEKHINNDIPFLGEN